MKRFFYIMITMLCTCQMMISQDSLALDISGSVDVYYRYNLGGDYDVAPGTSFANLPGFSLGMANLKIAKDGDKVGFLADLVVGPKGEDATFLSPFLRPGGSSNMVNQLNVYWNVSDEVTLTLGNFNTFLGYEVISPVDNFNYSTSYLFSYGPFSHTGIKADYANENGFSAMVGIFNPTDATEYNQTNDYTVGTQLGYTFGKGSIYLNGIYSSADSIDFYQVDITAGFDVTDDLYFGLNASKAKDAFSGVAAYVQLQATSNLKIGTRVEYFKDEGLGLFGLDENVLDLSLSANYSIGNLTLIPEFRLDKSSQAVFADGLDFKDSLSSFVLAAVYGF